MRTIDEQPKYVLADPALEWFLHFTFFEQYGDKCGCSFLTRNINEAAKYNSAENAERARVFVQDGTMHLGGLQQRLPLIPCELNTKHTLAGTKIKSDGDGT